MGEPLAGCVCMPRAGHDEWTCPCGLLWLRLGGVWLDARVQLVQPTSHQRVAKAEGPHGRVEADDEWLPDHSSATMAALSAHLPGLRRLSAGGQGLDAILAGSGLGTGRFVPPPQGAEASVVRYAQGQYAYTHISVSRRGMCATCGFDSIQTHRMQLLRESGSVLEVGSLSVCANCEPGSFLFTSHMPSVVHGQDMRARSVL